MTTRTRNRGGRVRLRDYWYTALPAGSPGYVARWRRERAPAVAIFRRRPIDRTRARQAPPPPPVLPGARAPLWFFFFSLLFALPLLGRVASRGGSQLRGPGLVGGREAEGACGARARACRRSGGRSALSLPPFSHSTSRSLSAAVPARRDRRRRRRRRRHAARYYFIGRQ